MRRIKSLLLYNWLAIGLTCAIKGNDIRSQSVGSGESRELRSPAPGKIEYIKTGKRHIFYVHVCSRCGYYRGSNHKDY